MKFSIFNGPNLNKLGTRNPDHYGTETLDDIEQLLTNTFPDDELVFFQSNLEGELVEAVQALLESDTDGLLANFAGYSHTSVAIRDAVELLNIPFVEVHLSNIHARDEFREKTLTGAMADGIITGFGSYGYVLGVQALQHLVAE